MPYPRWPTGQKWVECNICGFDFPLSQLKKDSFGSRRCYRCWDADSHQEHMRNVLLRFEDPQPTTEDEDMVL
jgi:hypothetical protein